MKKIILIISIILFTIIVIIFLFLSTTNNKGVGGVDDKLYSIRFAILQYYMVNREIPKKLDILFPERITDKNDFYDPWGRFFIYCYIDKEQYILLSLGADGRIGGSGFAKDKIVYEDLLRK